MTCFVMTIMLGIIAFPGMVSAAILINEVAWMGSPDSPNDEWIELYNDGDSSVHLDGWTLTDNVSLTVDLSGSVGAGAFAVLERIDDESAPGAAFLIYTGALSNDGRTLTLRRENGSIEDQVAGGEGWENIGGDNDSKATAQRTLSGWITATPTPGKENSTSEPDPQEAASDSEAERDNEEPGVRVSLSPPDSELSLLIDAPQIAYPHQPVFFSASANGIGERLIESLTYTWNFGDTYTKGGKEVSHAFTYPGEYVVVLEGNYGRYEASVRHMVTVLPATLSLSRSTEGDIHIHNDAKYEIDLSGYVLRADEELILPKHTILRSGATLTVDAARIEQGTEKMVALYDPLRILIASQVPPQLMAEKKTIPHSLSKTQPVSPYTPRETPDKTESSIVTKESYDSEVQDSRAGEVMLPMSPQVTAVSASDSTGVYNTLPYVALIGLIILGILALYSRRRL